MCLSDSGLLFLCSKQKGHDRQVPRETFSALKESVESVEHGNTMKHYIVNLLMDVPFSMPCGRDDDDDNHLGNN